MYSATLAAALVAASAQASRLTALTAQSTSCSASLYTYSENAPDLWDATEVQGEGVCDEAGWHFKSDFEHAWCNDFDGKFYKYTVDPTVFYCDWGEESFVMAPGEDLPIVCNRY